MDALATRGEWLIAVLRLSADWRELALHPPAQVHFGPVGRVHLLRRLGDDAGGYFDGPECPPGAPIPTAPSTPRSRPSSRLTQFTGAQTSSVVSTLLRSWTLRPSMKPSPWLTMPGMICSSSCATKPTNSPYPTAPRGDAATFRQSSACRCPCRCRSPDEAEATSSRPASYLAGHGLDALVRRRLLRQPPPGLKALLLLTTKLLEPPKVMRPVVPALPRVMEAPLGQLMAPFTGRPRSGVVTDAPALTFPPAPVFTAEILPLKLVAPLTPPLNVAKPVVTFRPPATVRPPLTVAPPFSDDAPATVSVELL